MKYSLGISNFLEEIASLSHSVVFLYFLALISEEVFLISPCFSSGQVWMWELDCEESWVPKNWCFWTVLWGRLLRVPWTAKRSNQSILKEISPGCSLEVLMLKLKLQYFGDLIRRTDSFEKTLMLRKIEGGRKRGWQRMRWLDGITDSMDWVWVNSGCCWWTGRRGVRRLMGSQRVRHDWAPELNCGMVYKVYINRVRV